MHRPVGTRSIRESSFLPPLLGNRDSLAYGRIRQGLANAAICQSQSLPGSLLIYHPLVTESLEPRCPTLLFDFKEVRLCAFCFRNPVGPGGGGVPCKEHARLDEEGVFSTRIERVDAVGVKGGEQFRRTFDLADEGEPKRGLGYPLRNVLLKAAVNYVGCVVDMAE